MKELKTPVLSLFQAEKCVFYDGQKCDFSSSPRPFYVVSVINRGRAVFKNESKTISLKEGDVFFIPMGGTYTSEWSGGSVVYCTSLFFAFEPGRDPTAGREYSLQKIEGETAEIVAKTILSLAQKKDRGSFVGFLEIGSFYKMCEKMFSSLVALPINQKTAPIRKALDYIDKNFDRDISVKALAEMCNFSESRFHHVFKEITGTSPIAYKHKVAVAHAEMYLGSDSGYSVEEVSDKCGFSSSIYFRRVFKKITGRSPREYKKESII